MRRRRFLELSLAMSCPLRAAEFWETTGVETWSVAQMKLVATNSPWAKSVNVRLPGSIISSVGSAPVGRGGPEDTGASRNDSSLSGTISNILVRWDSALPVVEACERSSNTEKDLFSCASKLFSLSTMGKKFSELRRDYYIIGLSNYPIMQRGKEAIQHSEAASAALEKMCERMRTTTWLRPKGRGPLQSDHIIALPWDRALLLLVFFPRTAEFSLDDREISFQSVNGTVEFKATFNLQKMKYQGRLAL
jgi:hypothetical protein